MNNLSQSKSGSRGPLIAVIKIQLDEQNVDRIFLHLKDEDQTLAQQFIAKHNLNPVLKKHIHQRIQMSRMAVDKQALNSSNRIESNKKTDNFKDNHFVTPTQKRQNSPPESQQKKDEKLFKYHRQQQINPKIQNERKTHNEQNRGKLSQTYVRQTNNMNKSKKQHLSHSNSKGSDYISDNYNNSQQQQQKVYNYKYNFLEDKNLDRFHKFNQLQNNAKYQSFNQSPIVPQFKKSSSQQPSYIQSTYSSKYKNVYDISGLKLANKAIHPKSMKAINQSKVKQSNQAAEYLSSQSSEGLFQKQISISKEKSPQNEGQFQKYNFNKEFIKNTYKENNLAKFNQVPESINKAQGSKMKNLQIQIDQFDNKKLSTQKYIDQLVNKKLQWKKENQSKLKRENQSHSLYSMNQKQKYSKFNNPLFSKQDSSTQTQPDYISFQHQNQIPSNQIDRNINLESRKHIQTLFQPNCSPKRIGSIRSNNKPTSDNFYQFNKINVSNHQSLFDKDNDSVGKNLDLQSTTKFNQQRLFHDIKDLQRIRQMQQNKIMNEQQTDRPSRVKFYNKEQMKSLRQSNLSRSISKSEISRINKEVTARLYNQVDIKKKYLDSLKSRAKNLKEQQLNELHQLTHKPSINMLSKMIGQRRIKDNKSVQDHLLQQGKLLQQKRQQMMSREARKKLQQCSFKPQINQQSYRINVQRSRSKTLMNSCIKSSKRQTNEIGFQPSINKLSNQLAKQKGNFQERQQTFLQQKNSKLFKKLQQKRLKQKADPVTGQKLFQPQLTQKSLKILKSSQTRSTKNIHNYLYQLSKVQHPFEQVSQKPTICSESLKIIQELHQKRLNWLFTQLDSNQDGQISSSKISINQIPTQILEIVAPVLYQMQQLNTELNIQDFKLAIKNLNRSLDPYQKSILYNYNYSNKPIRN